MHTWSINFPKFKDGKFCALLFLPYFSTGRPFTYIPNIWLLLSFHKISGKLFHKPSQRPDKNVLSLSPVCHFPFPVHTSWTAAFSAGFMSWVKSCDFQREEKFEVIDVFVAFSEKYFSLECWVRCWQISLQVKNGTMCFTLKCLCLFLELMLKDHSFQKCVSPYDPELGRKIIIYLNPRESSIFDECSEHSYVYLTLKFLDFSIK